MRHKNKIMKDIIALIEEGQIPMDESDVFKLFDWNKCVDLLVSKHIKNAKFGLHEDWDMTSATGFKDGRPFNGSDESVYGTFLGSWWATPYIIDTDTKQEYPCFKVIPEDNFSDKHIEAAEDWWPQDAARYYADKQYGDI